MHKFLLFCILLGCFCCASNVHAQTERQNDEPRTLTKLILDDDGELLGYILTVTSTSIYFETLDGRKIFVPKEVIVEINDTAKEGQEGSFKVAPEITNRYFITGSAIPVKKGQHTLELALPGPRIQLSLAYNITLNLATSFALNPLYINVKKSLKLNNQFYVAAGISYAQTTYGYFITETTNDYYLAPVLSVSYLSKEGSFTLNGSYLIYNNLDFTGSYSISLAFEKKVTKKRSFVFDSFIPLSGGNNNTAGLPLGPMIQLGVRNYPNEENAYQFGLTILHTSLPESLLIIPLPAIKWIHTF